MNLKWIECDGGPHILLEERLIEWWSGSHTSNYELACEVDDYIGVVLKDGNNCIVLSEDVMRSTWIPFELNNGGYIVVWNYAFEGIQDDYIAKRIRDISEKRYVSTDYRYIVINSLLYLFPACDEKPGYQYDKVAVQLEPGTYDIDRVESLEFEDCSFRVFRFRLIS